MPNCKIAIVGGGPKAASIAAKAWSIRQHTLGRVDIGVTVFEKSATGAAWDGGHGYTDGDQRMCTPAERDIGFPYENKSFGEPVNKLMMQNFSWQSYSVSLSKYGEWVDAGRRRLPHKTFAEYIAYCIKKSCVSVIYGNVNRIIFKKNKWKINYIDVDKGILEHPDEFDGVVITGTGPASRRFYKPHHPRILDGENFWREVDEIPDRVKVFDRELPIVILGSGGTSAAVASKLHRMRLKRPIMMVGSQPALFARIDSKFENQLFRDSNLWNALGLKEKKSFIDRLTKGVVWSNIIDELTNADIIYVHGTIKKIVLDTTKSVGDDVVVKYEISSKPGELVNLPASVIVDATGFDGLWFTNLLEDGLSSQINGNIIDIKTGMDNALRLAIAKNFHVPGLADAIGPSFTSLMGLGTLSDAILAPYARALAPNP